MPSANILRKAALAALLNAQDLYDEAKFLAQADYLARAAALAVIGIEECAKAVVYVSAALLPDKSERFLEKLNRHDVKHLISAEFEGAEIVTHEWLQILSQQTGLDVSREYRLVDIISEFSAIYASDKDRSTKTQVEDHHEMMKPENDDNLSTPYIKNAALYVDINAHAQHHGGRADADEGGFAQEYLTVTLGAEEYAIDILKVQEIRGWHQVTRVPNAPAHMLGVLNLRGTIVPIIDMRMRFHLAKVEYNPITVIIVLSVHSASGDHVFGIVVDSVSDVLDVKASDRKATLDFGAAVNTDFINGLATVGEHMVMLLDIDKLLSSDELSALANVSTAAE